MLPKGGERTIAVIVSGLPEELRNESSEAASQRYVKVRMHIHYRVELPVKVRFVPMSPAPMTTIVVLADSLDVMMRQTVARLTEDSLRQQIREMELQHKLRCEFSI